MAAGDINDALTNIPNVVLVDQADASAAPGAGYARLEVVDGVLGVRVGTGAWIALVSLVAGLLTPLAEKASPASTDLLLLQDEAAASVLKKVQVANLPTGGTGGGLFDAYAQYADQKAAGSDGGDAVATTWTDRVLNTEVTDAEGIGSVASDHVTLAAGTYYARAVAPFLCTNRVGIRLYDITNSAVLARGPVNQATAASSGGVCSEVSGIFTLAGEAAIAVQYYAVAAQATYGLGGGINQGTETFTVLDIWRYTA